MTVEDHLITAHFHLARIVSRADELLEQTRTELVRGAEWVVADQGRLDKLSQAVSAARQDLPSTVL